MVKKPATKVPDAWEDDDWEAQADKAATTGESEPATESQVKLSKKERLAQHAELNRKLWESAESPPPNFHYLASRSDPPLASTFKPAVTVLSRRPTPQLATRRPDDPNNPNAAAARDDDDDDDDENPKKVQLSPEEIRAKQLREREEKQRRYDEARAKIFGTSNTGSGGGGSGGAGASVAASNPSSGTSTPGTVTPPRPSGDGRGQRGRGRGRGGGYRYNSENRGDRDRDGNQRPGSQSGGSGRELYDPNFSPKPGFQLERRGGGSSGGVPLSGRSTPRDDDQVIRTPRGPDGSTRGFAPRGAKTG
ncbi:hypothetical protein F4809DRAFT_165364 [Biscogniauxia mediterranea]|nr:hypothetical protein F4809DRAFT_165364 [Biscogniauxia mediterranea]